MSEFRPDFYEELQAQFDTLVHANTIVPVHKRLAHDGMMFEIGAVIEDVKRQAAIVTVTDTAPDILTISHRLSAVTSDSQIKLTYLEGGAHTGGVPVTARNRNRTCQRQARAQHTSDVVVLDPGYPLRQVLVPAGVARDVETTWVLRPATSYIVLLENIGRRKTDVEINFEYFEVAYTR